MPKVVLIIPPSPWLISDTDLPFLGILYVASYLEERNINVQLCDLSGLEESQWKIPVGDCYGITGTSPNFPQIRSIVEKLKERENACVVVGGPHATTLPEHVLNNTKADACVIGEGEVVMLNLLHLPINEVPNVVYRDLSGEIVHTVRAPFSENIDEFPPPDLDLIDFYRYSKSQTFKYLLGECREATLITSRGCPFNCNFCAQSQIWRGKVRSHSIERTIEEIKELIRKYKVELVYILDDTFVISKWRVYEFCEEIKKIGIKWHCLNRVDCCDYDLLMAMKDSGCLQFVFGFESGSNKMLEKMNKRVTVERAYEAINTCEKTGIRIRGQMIVGFPGETEETVEETAQFIRKANYVDAFGIHIFQPFPGCSVWQTPEKYGYELNKDTNFEDYHTIGKADFKPNKSSDIVRWFNYLKRVAGDRNIEQKGMLND